MRRSLLFIVLLAISYASYGATINGHVTTAEKDPVIRAYIISLKNDQHTHTNQFGDFQLKEVEIGDTIQIIYLGYKAQKYLVQSLDKEIRIEMEEGSFELIEIVV